MTLEIRNKIDHKVGRALLREHLLDNAFEYAEVFNSDGWRVGTYKTMAGARRRAEKEGVDRILIINADMFGTPTEPSEHVDWNEPDVMTADEWNEYLGTTVEAFAAANPHMIVAEEK